MCFSILSVRLINKLKPWKIVFWLNFIEREIFILKAEILLNGTSASNGRKTLPLNFTIIIRHLGNWVGLNMPDSSHMLTCTCTHTPRPTRTHPHSHTHSYLWKTQLTHTRMVLCPQAQILYIFEALASNKSRFQYSRKRHVFSQQALLRLN